jgi:hypothetical protein
MVDDQHTASSTSASPPLHELTQPLISDDKLKQLYAAMLKRRLLTRASFLGKPTRSLMGFQEACEIGCTIDLRQQDTIAMAVSDPFATLRDMLQAHPQGALDQQDGIPIDRSPSVRVLQLDNSADRLMLATGVAFAYRSRTPDNVVIAFADAHALAEAREALFFAVAHRLPIIYVQQSGRPGKGDSSGKLKGSQPLTIPVDQSDVIAVYRVAHEAIDKARRGVGPTVIQSIQSAHQRGNSKNRSVYVNDPVEYMEKYLRTKSLWSDEFKREIEASAAEQVTRARATRQKKSPRIQLAQ